MSGSHLAPNTIQHARAHATVPSKFKRPLASFSVQKYTCASSPLKVKVTFSKSKQILSPWMRALPTVLMLSGAPLVTDRAGSFQSTQLPSPAPSFSICRKGFLRLQNEDSTAIYTHSWFLLHQVLYSDSFRKQIQGKAAYVLDTPEMRRVRETQRHISTVSRGLFRMARPACGSRGGRK